MKRPVTIEVNGRPQSREVEARTLLVHFLRDELRLTGTHVGCETSICGACTVLVGGEAVKSCTVLAVQCNGASVTTIEGLSAGGDLDPLQKGFWECHGLQCGFCTPGIIMAAKELLVRNPDPSVDEIRSGLKGNLCRCTGYQHIIESIQYAARLRRPGQLKAMDQGGAASGPHRDLDLTTAPTEAKYVGQPVKRKEDLRLITGQGHYVDDVGLPDTLHAQILRSPYAHAKIAGISTSRASSLPGVVAIYTYGDIAPKCGPVPAVDPGIEGLKVPDHPVLAKDEVCFAGQPVAVVVSENRYVSSDAIELIDVDYEPLPVVTDPRVAMGPEAPRVHESLPSNVSFEWTLQGGEPDDAFQKAEIVLRERIVGQRLVPSALETRGVLARYFPGEEELTVWTSTQTPYMVRTHLANMLGIPENHVRVVAPEVGGGFGSKLNVYAEEGLLAAIAMLLAPRPVKWIESRSENFVGTTHGRDQAGDVEVAATREGKLLGIRYDAVADIGAYHQLFTPRIPTLTGRMLSGCYALPAAKITLTGVFTNKMSTDAYRGAGRPEGAYIVERMMDLLARDLALDPIEVRRRNFIRSFPFASVTGVVYDTGDYDKALNRLLELADYVALRSEQASRRAEGDLVGIGVATYVEISGMGPSRIMTTGAWESAKVSVGPTGTVEVTTGTCSHGQGQETTFAQLVADELGVSIERVKVFRGDTARLAYGTGTFGSRATAVGGTAVLKATRRILTKMRIIAAEMLGVDRETIRVEREAFRSGGRRVAFAEVCYQAHRAKELPKGIDPGLEQICVFEPENFSFPFGAHLCQVQVDPEAGAITIEKYYAVEDCGRVINPLLVDGQVHGGIAQGLGQALFEEALYDSEGQLLNGTFMGYPLPKASHLPWFHCDRTETPTHLNPMGVKGVGESGTIGATPALVNAVMDALAPYGIRHIDMPLRPEKIWRAIREANRSDATRRG